MGWYDWGSSRQRSNPNPRADVLPSRYDPSIPRSPEQMETLLRQAQQDIGRQASTGARRTGSRTTWNLPGGFTPAARRQTGSLDVQARDEIGYLQAMLQNQLAEYEQQRQAGEVRAEEQRIPVRRDINVQNRYTPLAQAGVNQETDELLQALQAVIPQTEQAYTQGAQQVGQAYSTGAQNLAAQIAGNSNLSTELQAMAGSSGDLENQMEGSTQFISNLLNTAGAQESGSLANQGAAETAAIRNTLGGYGQEAQQINSDIALQSAADIQGLQQQLALIRPEFLPFNYGELMLNTQQGVRDAIRAGMERGRVERERADEEEANRTRYTGYEGAQQYAARAGRPRLARELMQMIAASEQAGTGQGGIYSAIEQFGADPRVEIQEMIESGAKEDLIRTRAEELGLNYDRDYKPRGGGLGFNWTNTGLGVSIPNISMRSSERPNLNTRPNARQASQAQRDRDLLQELLTIYQGNYANYPGP